MSTSSNTTHHSCASTVTLCEAFWWTQRYQWLLRNGYRLQSNHNPVLDEKTRPKRSNNHSDPEREYVNYGTRLTDGKEVVLKRLTSPEDEQELALLDFLSQEPLASDARNHCVPVLDTLLVPGDENTVVIVMPLLHSLGDAKLETIGDAVELFHQLFEGVQFLHDYRIAHRDISYGNVMYETCRGRTRYYLIDFGLSRCYDLGSSPLEIHHEGTDFSVPEFSTLQPYDPFPVDVYCLGNFLRHEFLETRTGFAFLRPLVQSMTQAESLRRPDIATAFKHLKALTRDLPPRKLKSRSRQVDVKKRWSILSLAAALLQLILQLILTLVFHWVPNARKILASWDSAKITAEHFAEPRRKPRWTDGVDIILYFCLGP
ncbi:other/AgaK1 protein kinase [Coprinopsis cinerea okayama7|uniref:Other/AgaK1 protein kinase n=1 Tax=Coprinopsis cinerea (strain Okayama-7 / 130 / ATCC MYA-4618 / FGSC 9003) TaxID=240176 RepID=A8NNV9_COPC7|nr:other/AgaK1 protein kinase [Coprinopsis cinerea okayama7\|eukprot:XP_001835208.1 other/AgaK1 protein kinase [Coprinopsis cinerea okayama7\